MDDDTDTNITESKYRICRNSFKNVVRLKAIGELVYLAPILKKGHSDSHVYFGKLSAFILIITMALMNQYIIAIIQLLYRLGFRSFDKQ